MARYFVGNGTNWSSTSSWATTDGGTPGAAVPLSSDDVYLTALSPGNLTIDTTANCKNFDCTGFTHALIATAATLNVTGVATALAITGGNSSTAYLNIVGGLTVTGTLTLNAYSASVPLLVQSSVVGTTRTISAGTFVATNRIDFQDITASGAATWTPASGGILGDCLGNTGITFTQAAGTANGLGGVYRYAKTAGNWSSTGVWSTTSGGSTGASVPLPQDTAVLDVNSGAGTYAGDVQRLCRDLVCTGFTRTLSFINLVNYIYGNVTLASGMTYVQGVATRLCGRGAQTVTSAGKTGCYFYISCPGGSYTLQDDLIDAWGIYQASLLGTFNDGGHNVSLVSGGGYTNTASTANSLTISGTWTLKGTAGWTLLNTNATLTATGSTIIFADTSSSAKALYGGGKHYGTVSITGGGTGAVYLDGNNTFDTLTIGAPKTVIFTKSTTTTVTTFNATGSAGNVITITSDTAGTYATINKTSGNVVCDYLSLKDSHAGGGATWYAGSHSTLVSGTTGWLLADPPVNATVVAPPATTLASAVVSGLDNARAPPAAAATATAPVPTTGIFASITPVQRFISTTATPSLNAVHPNSGTSAGNTLILTVGGSGGGRVSSVSDTKGNTWYVDVQTTGTSRTMSICSTRSTGALTTGDTITITYAGSFSNASPVVGFEYPAVLTFDVSASNQGTVGTSGSAGPTGTTAQAGELAVTAISVNVTMTTASLTGAWGIEATGQVQASYADQTLGAPQTVSAPWSWSPTGAWAIAVATYVLTGQNAAVTAVPALASATTPVPALQASQNVSLSAVSPGATSSVPVPALRTDTIVSAPCATTTASAPIPRLTVIQAPIAIDAELRLDQPYAAYLADAQAYTVDLALE